MKKIFTIIDDQLKKMLIKAIVINVNKSNYRKNCLMLYITHPFIQATTVEYHQNIWQVREIARLIGEQGYNVDVVDYRNTKIKLKKRYDLIFDICPQKHPVYEKNLNPGAKKIVYFTGSNSTFANAAEIRRLADLEKRRGVRLSPRRQAPITPSIVENFDAVFGICNQYNMKTYQDEFKLPEIYLIPNTGYDFEGRFNTRVLIQEGKRRGDHFLFFGSLGAVHKGLDRLLEIFSETDFPAALYVCGSFKQEKDFEQTYTKELYNTCNIKAVGFVDIWSDEFVKVVEKCAYAIFPSCSEGQSGAVLTVMSAGVIPICSKECGYDNDEVIVMPDCEMGTIRDMVLEYIKKDKDWIIKNSEYAQKIVKIKHSRNTFTKAFRRALSSTLKTV